MSFDHFFLMGSRYLSYFCFAYVDGGPSRGSKHPHPEYKCFFGKIILGQVTLSPTGLILLHRTRFSINCFWIVLGCTIFIIFLIYFINYTVNHLDIEIHIGIFWAVRVVDSWNSLPDAVKTSPTVNFFKSRLDNLMDRGILWGEFLRMMFYELDPAGIIQFWLWCDLYAGVSQLLSLNISTFNYIK